MNVSQLAKLLKPYVVKWIQAAQLGGAASGAASGGGGGGGLVQHDLDGAYHRGVLGSSKYPEALLVSGARALTGSLNVADGVTIDGVDLSVHAGSASAHHAPATAGNGITVTGQSVAARLKTTSGLEVDGTGLALADSVAGDGLTISGKVLAVGAGADIGVTANAVEVISASDVGTAPTQAKVLKSTAFGGIILGVLEVKGATTVGQDLTSGNGAFKVIYETDGGSHVHVRINPTDSIVDQQFGMDIYDNLRVRGWIVGKHAIQLDDCTMLLHYDGPERSPDLSGQTRGHLGQVPMLESGVTFAPGKFGMAVQTPVATTNLVTNPSFETGVTGWIVYGNSIGTLSRVTTMAYAGNYAYQIAKTSGANTDWYGTYRLFSATSGITYTASAWVNTTESIGGNRAFVLRVQGTGVVPTTSTTLTGVTDKWVRLSVTFTATGTGSAQLQMYWYNVTTGTAYIDAVQIEESSYATAYCDGTLGAGHSWSGTAHASTSSRTAATLDYNVTNALNAGAGTIAAWVRPTASGVRQMVFSTGAGFWLRATSGGAWEWAFANVAQAAAGAWTANTWHYVVVTWNSTNAYLYIDGALVKTVVGGVQTAGMTQLSVGRYRPSSSQYWTGLIDEVMLRSVETTADQVRAVYESEAPVFAETSTWHWRAGVNRLYADAQGLWGMGASGGALIGLYFGSESDPAATKSWGNVDLSEGDMLLGTYGANNGGWMWFDQDLVGGVGQWKFGYADKTVLLLDSGGATLDGVLDIGTTGGIYQGTGTFAAPEGGIGLKIWSDGGKGRIAGYNGSTTPEWYADTDGKLKAGGGTVVLDANGMAIRASTSYALKNAVTWVDGSNNEEARVWGKNGASQVELNLDARPANTASVRDAVIRLQAIGRGVGALAQIYLTATNIYADGELKVNGSLVVDGDTGGQAGTVGLTDVTNTAANSTGVGTIKMKGTTSRDSTGFVKIYIGTTAYYVPVFAAITG